MLRRCDRAFEPARHYHREPFVCILVAQLIVETLQIIGVYPVLNAFPIRQLW